MDRPVRRCEHACECESQMPAVESVAALLASDVPEMLMENPGFRNH